MQPFDSIKESAENGDMEAQYLLGVLCNKDTTGSYPDEALKWYMKAAEQGHAEAQYVLGVMFDRGFDVREDPDLAFDMFKKAAEQGHVNAQFELGYKYMQEKYVEPNIAESRRWFRMALEASEHNDVRMTSYAMNMYRLQMFTGMTFIEAEAFLNEHYGVIREEDPISRNRDIYDSIGRSRAAHDEMMTMALEEANRKIKESGSSIDDVFGKYFPTKEYFKT